MKQSEPSIIVIFGITGDLAQRKLLPALYHLFKDGLLHAETRIVGLSRRDMTADELLGKVELCVIENDNVCDPAVIKLFRNNLAMLQLNPAQASEYDNLKTKLDEIEDQQGICMNRLFYLSIPPSVYGVVVRNLGESGIAKGCHHGTASSNLLIEKPFGYDMTSAKELIDDTNRYFKESQLYRIDHFLAKETAQNILTFRNRNPVFASIWDGDHIDRIEIIASETLGVEGRSGFYDDIGALRDLIQSHLMQLLAVVTLDIPDSLTATTVHAAKHKLLDSIEAVPADKVIERAQRAQYEDYAKDVSNPGSQTETFAAVSLNIPTPRWQKTSFWLATGKKLADKRTHIRVIFRGAGDTEGNTLTFRLQPNEGIDIGLVVKKPGFENATEQVLMDFDYHVAAHPDAYERVLVDAIRGDQTLFASSDEVIAAWRVVENVVTSWQRSGQAIKTYPSGTDINNVLGSSSKHA